MASARRKAPARQREASTSPGDATASVAEGRVRAVIDAVLPTVDGGRFPAKRIAGEVVGIEAHCFTDGHDKLRVVLRWKLRDSAQADFEINMTALSNDVWTAEIHAPAAGPLPMHRHRVGGSLRVLAPRFRTT